MSRARALLLILVTILSTAILTSLAGWQWQRRAEKREMIAGIAKAASQAALPYSDPANRKSWARVSASGRFLHDKTVYIRTSRAEPKPGERDSRGNRPYSGFGVMVMTPLLPDCDKPPCNMDALVINRGFLPTLPDGKIPDHSKPSGMVSISGFLRPTEPQRLLPPYNSPEKGVYFTRDIVEIALRTGLPGAIHREAATYIYSNFLDREAGSDDAEPPFGIVPAEFIKAIPDNHASYAMTWASLAAINLGIAMMMLFRRRKTPAKG